MLSISLLLLIVLSNKELRLGIASCRLRFKKNLSVLVNYNVI